MPREPKAPRRPNRDGSQSGDLQKSGEAAGASPADNADLEDANSRLKAENDELSHKLTEAEREARLQKSAANKARAQSQVQQIEKKQMEREARDAKKQAELANQEVDNVVFEVVVGMSLDADPAQKPDGVVQHGLKHFIDSTLFNGVVYSAILLNCVTLAANNPNPDEQYRPSPGMNDFYVICEQAFTIIFNAEMAIKLAALHMEYFNDNWNNFDFTVVWGAWIGRVIAIVAPGVPIAPVMSTLRVLRLVRLLQSLPSIRAIIYTLMVTFPQVVNIAMLLGLVLFIFAILGVQFFAGLMWAEGPVSGNIDAHANFQSFFTAFLTLFRSCTGENWNGMMYAMATNAPGCVDDPPFHPNTCGMGCPTCAGSDHHQQLQGQQQQFMIQKAITDLKKTEAEVRKLLAQARLAVAADDLPRRAHQA